MHRILELNMHSS